MLMFVFPERGARYSLPLRLRKEFLSCQGLSRFGERTIGALCAERHILTSAKWNLVFRKSRATLVRLPLYLFLQSAQYTQNFPVLARIFAVSPLLDISTSHLLCLRYARALPLLPAALASVSFGFVLVRVRVQPPTGGSEKKTLNHYHCSLL